MAGVSIKETLELWASSLRAVKARMRPLFLQERMAASAGLFLDGLLGGERRKTVWSRAEAAGDPGPWRQQAILGRGQRDADALRDIVRDYALERLSDLDAVLVIDELHAWRTNAAPTAVVRGKIRPSAMNKVRLWLTLRATLRGDGRGEDRGWHARTSGALRA